jgi:glycosyltransferase involved in cell wall biosynthesis
MAYAEVIPNVVPVEAIDETPRAILTEENLVLFVGRLSEEKCHLVFVEAMRSVVREVPAHALICGDGPLRRKIEDAVRTAGVSQHVSMAGYRDDVWSLMKAARALVSTSIFEGRPNAVLEAMAARCPLVLSDIPGHREVADDSMARLVPINRPDELARALTETIRGGTAVGARVRAARFAAESWSPAELVERYEHVYRRVVSQRSDARALFRTLQRRHQVRVERVAPSDEDKTARTR